MGLFLRLAQVAFVLTIASWTVPAWGQPTLHDTENIAGDRPEAWAIRYFTSTTLLNGLGVSHGRQAGSVFIGGEVVGIPFLSTEEQRVGFNGTKAEDLNKAPFFVRPRLIVGLPGQVAATLAF